jgi:hypothetical protein
MPRLALETPHAIGQDEAMRRLKKKFAAVRAMHGDRVNNLREEWQDHTLAFGFQAMGMSVSGTVAVESDRVKLDASLPLAAMMFKGMIEQQIRKEMDGLLSS